jgi:hypothetical protein
MHNVRVLNLSSWLNSITCRLQPLSVPIPSFCPLGTLAAVWSVVTAFTLRVPVPLSAVVVPVCSLASVRPFVVVWCVGVALRLGLKFRRAFQ